MHSLIFFYKTACRNLVRGGQRTIVALLCITFGVMSLVAMTILSHSLNQTMVLDPPEIFGGDISLGRKTETIVSTEHIAELDRMVRAGEIDRYTLIAFTSSLTLRKSDSGELHFIPSGMGIEPEVYPLAGSLEIREPGNVGLPTLLQNPGDIVITRDLVVECDLHVGDEVVLADMNTGVPVRGVVRGIAGDTPNHQGSKVYYTIETAELLEHGQPVVNTVLVNSANPEAAAAMLDANGWFATTAEQLAGNDKEIHDLFDTLFKGAGIMGLMVGGIGIANTMQVLLRRRQREIAILKALGYKEKQLQALFTLEAAILGVLGSFLGVGLGLAVSILLVHLFSRTTNLLVSWSFSPYPPVYGWFVGLVTTVIFALWAILSVGRAQPMALLRNEPVRGENIPKIKSAGYAVALGIPFTAITSLIMSSLLKGIGVLAVSLIGLCILGGGLGGLVWLITHLLPLKSLPLARIAQVSLRRRGWNLVFAMIALFTGIVAMALGVTFTQIAQGEMDERDIEIEGYIIRVTGPFSQEGDIRRAVEELQGIEVAYGYHATVEAIRVVNSEIEGQIQPVLLGRSEPGEFIIGSEWDNQGRGVYAYEPSGVTAGSQVEVTFRDGTTRILEVTGTYDVDWDVNYLPVELGLLMPTGMVSSLVEPDTITCYIKAPASMADEISEALGKALPGSTVINLVAYLARFTQTFRNLFILALAMSGLALLAGVLLIANSVSLALLDRRYEIGILKAVGYTRFHILSVLAVEYSLTALLATLAGLAVVQLFFWIIGLLNDIAARLLTMEPTSAVIILICGVGLVLATVIGVSWGPTRQPPVTVLSDHA